MEGPGFQVGGFERSPADPFIFLALLISPSPSLFIHVTRRSGVTKRALLPPPHYGTRLRFYREKTSALSSLVDSHRIASTHATKQALSALDSFYVPGIIFPNKAKRPAQAGFEPQNQDF